MSEFKEFSGKNIDEAIEEACKKFNASRDKLEIEIMSGGSTGIFGLVGVKKASVRARMRQTDSAAQEKGPKQQPKPKDKPKEQQPREQLAKDKPKGQEQTKPKEQQPQAKAKEQPQAEAKDQAEATRGEGTPQAGQPGEKPADDKPRQSRGRGRRKPKAKPAQQDVAGQAEQAEQPVQKQADDEQPQNGKPGGRRRGGRRRPRKNQDSQNAGPKNGNSRNQAANGNDNGNGNGKPAAQEKPVDDTEALEAKDLVLDVVGKLIEPIVTGVKLSAEVEPGRVKVIVEDDENAGLIIGSDGQTISSLQYLANRIVARQVKGNVRVHLDAGDYRERQDDSLRQLAWSLADKAKNQGRTQATRPLSSYHRRVVHMALQEDDGIQTLSKGEGPMKRVLILPRPRNNH